ncbi:unnamed protein product [Moneuplotes crassus]|uniref:AMMECR1 domain-containing protein n=1 Tax=Euplotes crassus TaxID=5936 RepID=A0AAD1XWW9_EUPCR|nr:unnamed protein product [Moneuplotes crassus]
MEDGTVNDPSVQDKMCAYCFDNLKEIHSNGEILMYPKDLPNGEYPLFITWQLDKILRGCIGTFKAELLSKLVPLYCYIAAFKDDRFPPISEKEIPLLTCSVSLLSNFENIEDPLDFEIGKHGMEVEFEVDEKKYRSTYLPHVPFEQNWTQEHTLDKLISKAGYKDGKYEDIKDKFTKATRYQSIKFKMTHQQYLEHKEKLGKSTEENKEEGE